jgi:hypothetical protein
MVAVPIWGRPVVPSELSRDPEFTEKLHGQLVNATSTVQLGYVSKDPSFRATAARLPDVLEALASLQTAVDDTESAAPAEVHQLLQMCTSAIKRAIGRAQQAAQAKNETQVGSVAALLAADEEEDRLNKVREACLTKLNSQLNDHGIAAAASRLEQIHLDMEQSYGQIDQSLASRQAETEMAYVKRTVKTLVNDLNLVAVSPVLIFDVAHLGPADNRLGTRYGIGGGVRVSLASSVDFNAGYVVNPKRLGGEPPGAFFFSIDFKDLLQ